MNIGYLSPSKRPNDLAELIAIACSYKGISFIYLTPKNIKADSETVKGLMFLNNEWKKVSLPLPEFIDISPYCFRRLSKNQLTFLRENTMLSDTGERRYNKVRLQGYLDKDESLKDLLIPTKEVKSINSLYNYLNEYNEVILKPKSGQFGRGIYSIVIADDKYIIKGGRHIETLNEAGLKDFYNREIENENYIVQKFINSKTAQGYPFDCRINAEKNSEGKWTIARKFFRIGVGQKVVSNISQGGGVSSTTSFLNANFPKSQIDINRKLEEIGKTLPYKIEEIRKINLVKMGIDLGIDSNGNIYLFEVNSSPGTTQLRDKVALLRTDYYEHVIKNNKKVE